MESKTWKLLLLLLVGGVLLFSLAGCGEEETTLGDAVDGVTNAAEEAAEGAINQDCCGGSCKTPAGYCCGTCCDDLPKYEP